MNELHEYLHTVKRFDSCHFKPLQNSSAVKKKILSEFLNNLFFFVLFFFSVAATTVEPSGTIADRLIFPSVLIVVDDL